MLSVLIVLPNVIEFIRASACLSSLLESFPSINATEPRQKSVEQTPAGLLDNEDDDVGNGNVVQLEEQMEVATRAE